MTKPNHYGSIEADVVYVESELIDILDITQRQLLEYYKDGLKFFQKKREQPRQIAGIVYLRYIEKKSRQWREDEGERA